MSETRVLVAGGGIGGLCAAIALRRLGVAVEVAERMGGFRPVGAGITLQPNAMAVLEALGVDIPADEGFPLGGVALVDHRGRPLVAGAPAAGLATTSLNVRRAALHDALLKAVGDTPIHLGREVVRVRETSGRLEVGFTDGDGGVWDLVIGADGLRSRVRDSLLGADATRLRHSGQTCWRFSVDAPDLATDRAVERWGDRRRLGVVPLSRGGTYVYA
ncbi:MAG: FAD-dependent monooxygenase, partial [Thermoanaerobaculia bacterium]|nr:FAD-dependent monooxygenase [Thermoanaerobaculia bacterium]